MVVNRKPTGRAVSIPAGLCIGGIFAMLWSIVGAVITAKMIEGEMIPESSIGYGAMLVLLTGSFGASLVAFHKIKRQRAAVCMAMGGVYLLLLLAINALFFGGQYAGIGATALVILAGSGCAVLMGLGQGSRKRHTAYKIHKG